MFQNCFLQMLFSFKSRPTPPLNFLPYAPAYHAKVLNETEN